MLLRCLPALILTLVLVLPAQAALTLGVTQTPAGSQGSETVARRLAAQLQTLLEEDVRLRVFRNEGELGEWLLRYRMVDLALVSTTFYHNQPAGTLHPLPLSLSGPEVGSLLVARPGLKAERLAQLRRVVATLDPPPPLPAPTAGAEVGQQTVRSRRPVGSSPGDGELRPGHEILATPGTTPRITAQPPRPAPRATARKTQPGPQKESTRQPTATRGDASAPPTPASNPAAPAPAAAKVQPSPQSPPTPAPALVLPPPQPAPVPSPSPAPPPTTVATPGPNTTPASTETGFTDASPVPWFGILVLLSGFGYLTYRRRQQARPIDWAAVQKKAPRGEAPGRPAKRATTPTDSPRPGEALSAPTLPGTTRVVLPPRRKPDTNKDSLAEPIPVAGRATSAEPPAAPPSAPEGIALVAVSEEVQDSLAALLTNDVPGEALSQGQEPEADSAAATVQVAAHTLEIPPLELEDLPQPPPWVTAAPEFEPDRTGATPSPEAPARSLVERPPQKPSTPLPPLRGDFAAVVIPQLLETAAAQPRPCILHIRGPHDEKRLHFRLGHLADASSVNRANRAKTGFLMNKVGYLLIRQGRITEEQRDQALRLCEERPKLRIGEALIELGALTRESLLEALQTQAEGVIFSLFIFPTGRYEIVADDSDGTAANDLEIDLQKLLAKAAAQEPEWERIRQAIPSLDTVLDFPEGGREKLDSARMTEHQRLVLSLINGHRPIRDICIAATMLDLEVYKFLFFMVNAKILTRVDG